MEITETKCGKATILTVKGRLDAVTSNPLQERWMGLIQQGDRQLVLDGSELAHVSSSGLRILLIVSRRLKDPPEAIAVCALKPRIQQIFEIAGFAGMFPVNASLEEAVQTLDRIA